MLYRTELFAGSGVRDAAEVLAFEAFELGNSDVCYALLCLLEYHNLAEECEIIGEELQDQGFISDWTFDNAKSFFSKVLDAIKDVTGKRIRYALWLADKPNAYRYLLGAERASAMSEHVSEQDVPENCEGIDAYDETGGLILVDLGADGALYGFEELPEPI